MSTRAKLDSVALYNDVSGGERTWKVRMPDGATKAMSVEELDAAFDASRIGLTTLVQRPSGGEWRTLGEAAGVDDSIRPVSSDFELVEIPRPPPLPVRFTTDELETIVPPRKIGRLVAAVAAFGLLVGGVVAWRYLPAQPAVALATTTIPAPQPNVIHAAAPTAAQVEPEHATPAPEAAPAPEPVIAQATPAKAVTPVKATTKPAKQKTTTWKQRVKLHAKKKNA